MNATKRRTSTRFLAAAPLAVACLIPAQSTAADTGHDACQGLAGTYVTTVTDIEGVFSSRGLLTLGADGVFLMSDSAQAGLPGVYDPFGSAQGSWRCLGVEGTRLRFSAVGLNFVLPGDGRAAVFGRVEYRGSLDTQNGVLSATTSLSFSPDGDLEGADPMERPGPVFEQFDVEGKAVVPPADTPADTNTVRYDCGDGYEIEAAVAAVDNGDMEARLRSPAGDMRLPAVRSGSGARYAADGNEFWIKGDEALFTPSGEEMKRCRALD